jgi:uncharacterized membrane protein YccC
MKHERLAFAGAALAAVACCAGPLVLPAIAAAVAGSVLLGVAAGAAIVAGVCALLYFSRRHHRLEPAEDVGASSNGAPTPRRPDVAPTKRTEASR